MTLSSPTELKVWSNRSDRTLEVSQPTESQWGKISPRGHFAVSLILLALATYADVSRPFGKSWSITYLIPVLYAGSTMRGRSEILFYSVTCATSFLAPYLDRPELYWTRTGLHTRTMGAFVGIIIVGLMRERRRYIEALQISNSDLERHVALRTAELQRTNDSLQLEMLEREKSVANEHRLEAELRQAQKLEAIGALAGGVAHDFNNLLTVINGYSSLLIDQIPADSSLKSSVEEIVKAGERAAELTQQLLAFSRKQVYHPTLVEMNLTLTRSEGLLKCLLHENVHVIFDLSRVPCTILADEGQLIQILLNLAGNAQDAMPDGGDLKIRTARVDLNSEQVASLEGLAPGPHVKLTVLDTGTGMDEVTRNRVFEPFFTTKNPGKGTGLGLASVYGIVKRSGGHIEVESHPGQGTRFDIYFPAARQGLLPKPQIAAPPAPQSVNPATIMLVEDNRSVRLFVAGILRQAGYQIIEAGNGQEALATVAANGIVPISLLISDVVMPEMGGPALVERLAEKFPELKVLFVSGYSENDFPSSRNVPFDFLPKPFSRTDLLVKIESMLTPSAGGESPFD